MLTLISRRILTIYALCCAFLIAALLIGATISMPVHTSLFTRSLCALPCVYGLVPGVSTRDQARQTLAPSDLSLSLIDTNQPSYILRQTDASRSMLARIDFGSATSAIVHSVQLYPMSATFDLGTLSDFLLAGDQPIRVLTGCQSQDAMIITFDSDTYVEISISDGLAPDTIIRQLGTADSSALQSSLDQFACAVQSSWSGFAALWKYGSNS